MNTNEFIDKYRAFNRYYADLLSSFDRTLYGDPFTLVEDRVVTAIWDNEPISPAEISNELNLNKSQLSKILSKLAKQEVISRTANPQDKRSTLITLTAHGKSLQRQQVGIVHTGLHQFFVPYTHTQLRRIDSAMTTLQKALTNQHEVKIEPGQLADIGYIADLHARVYTSRGYHAVFQYYVLAALADYAKSKMDGVTFIAKVDGQRAGTISLVEAEDGNWQVRWFVVDPLFQGHGLGKQLMQALMDYAKQNEITKMYLWTVSELKAARSLYGRNGFAQVESKQNTEWKDDPVMEERWEYRG
ncbi:GNAT family N-acetyltransferase [Lacticaseibacillus pabuli]|uniref:GNAT family N-acetyltransferase n=1 Tax=Lacticaseibacillus pabuli TaxID=3025672 RepID=A0ABY7WRT9_9LACO|nr:GNAT family N-acetyltransferase [Lacticaseibacillus sp. KACC 23028]WDF82904.1 GNAT family N-acetyltransferase [Lacticaseibacillus sp. KACC 23028]